MRAMASEYFTLLRPLLDSIGTGLLTGLLEFLVVAAALDHEAVDDAVENRAFIKARLHIVDEIVDRLRRLFAVQFQHDIAHRGLEFLRGGRGRGQRGAGEREAGEGGHQFGTHHLCLVLNRQNPVTDEAYAVFINAILVPFYPLEGRNKNIPKVPPGPR
jgi:hypothetical protein